MFLFLKLSELNYIYFYLYKQKKEGYFLIPPLMGEMSVQVAKIWDSNFP